MSENELGLGQDEGVEFTEEELEKVDGGANRLPRRRKEVVCFKCRKTGYIRRGETTCPNCGAPLEKSQLF